MQENLDIIKSSVIKMGGTIEEFLPERGCFYINVFGKRILLEKKISISRKSFVSGLLTKCKDITHKLLLAYGLPTPPTECFYHKSFDKNVALAKLNKLKYPIIIKDSSGSQSLGIFSFIQSPEEGLKTIKKYLPRYKSMIAQEMVFGKEYRVLVLGEKIIAALEMLHPCVIGDGKSTVRQLIKEMQKTTYKQTKLDSKLKLVLEKQHATLNTTLKKNKTIFIRTISSLAEGGKTKDASDKIHPDVTKICVSASKAVGKHLVGIDIICNNISSKPTKKNFHLLEINGKPDLYIHYKPNFGKTRDVVKPIIKFMVKLAIPIQSRS